MSKASMPQYFKICTVALGTLIYPQIGRGVRCLTTILRQAKAAVARLCPSKAIGCSESRKS